MGILDTDMEDDVKDTLESTVDDKDDSNDSDTSLDGDLSKVSGDTPTLVLNGPLSEIMTRALNLALSNESTMTTMVSLFNIEKDRRDKDSITDKDIYVYATDSDNLEGNGLITSIREIDNNSKGYRNVVVSVECKNGVTKHAQLFTDLYTGKKYQVFTITSEAIENLLRYRRTDNDNPN